MIMLLRQSVFVFFTVLILSYADSDWAHSKDGDALCIYCAKIITVIDGDTFRVDIYVAAYKKKNNLGKILEHKGLAKKWYYDEGEPEPGRC